MRRTATRRSGPDARASAGGDDGRKGPAAEPSPPSALPTVVLAGRVNVGKSTLFNRILGVSRAVVDPTPGVTRDRVAAEAEWAGWRFSVVDTGGLSGGEADPFAALVAAQTESALATADVVVLVVDAQAGLVPGDRDIAARLRRLRAPVVVWANKSEGRAAAVADFYALGLGEPRPVSALRGEGLGDALDEVVAALRAAPPFPPAPLADADAPPPLAFVGRPNVGKSSLVNRLLGAQRLIVSPAAGTTRDAVDVPWVAGGRRFLLVDTPGLRRPARIDPKGLERWVAARSRAAIGRAEVAVLVLDARDGCTDQDKRIGGLVHDRGRGAVLLLNKVDLLPAAELQEVARRLRAELRFLDWAPLLLCSAQTGRGCAELAAVAGRVADNYRRRLPTAAVNACLREAVALHPPPSYAGKAVRVLYAAQIGVRPPTIAVVISRAGAIPPEYVRHLENRLRERFPLEGTPVRWVFRERRRRPSRLRRADPG